MVRRLLLCVFPLVFFAAIATAQSTLHDTTFLQIARKNSVGLYINSIEGQSNLYNGGLYVEPEQTNDTHPFFESNDWIFGSIEYHGDVYHNVPLLYDITSNKVITELFYNGMPIVLISERIQSFTMGDSRFRKIINETVNNSLPQTGFYEILYDGKTQMIALHQKQPQERVEPTRIEIDFEQRNRYYLAQSGSYVRIRNKAALLKTLADEKQALRQFARKNQLNFKANPEAYLAKLAEHYDNLKSQTQ